MTVATEFPSLELELDFRLLPCLSALRSRCTVVRDPMDEPELLLVESSEVEEEVEEFSISASTPGCDSSSIIA